MEMRALELKRLKRAYIREKRKFVTAWKALAIVMLVLALVFTPLTAAVWTFDNAVATCVGGTFWRLVGEDSTAMPFKADYTSREQLNEALLAVNQQAALEGTVLLKNEGVLPLQKGSDVCWFYSVERPELTENTGFDNVVATEGTGPFHADVGVVVLTGKENEQAMMANAVQEKAAGRIEKLVYILGGVQIADLEQADAVLWQGALDYAAVGKILSGEMSPAGRLPFTYSKLPVPENSGIYTDYKYYETRYADAIMGNESEYVYQNAVAYPFGYGLSYTAFQYENLSVVYEGISDTYSVTVTVTNGGDAAGRETVQVYAQTPDKANGEEKPAVQLVGFAKTKILQSGESEQITIPVKGEELASFDGRSAYILDAGAYYLTVAADSHAAVNHILAAKGFAAEGDSALVYGWERAESTILGSEALVSTATASVPETTFAPYSPGDYPTVPMPTLGAQNGLKLYDLAGVPFGDARWQTLLDQLTFADMVQLISDSSGFKMPVPSVQAPGAREGSRSGQLPAETVLAASFDTALAGEAGKVMSNLALYDGFAYLRCDGSVYSPDGFLGGKIFAAQMGALAEKGVNGVLTGMDDLWQNAQRLQVAKYALLEGKVKNVAFAKPVSKDAIDLLRESWGALGISFDGDLSGKGAAAVMAGVSAYTGKAPYMTAELRGYENDPVVVTAMRQACHYELYALVNSAAMNGIGPDTQIQPVQHWLLTVCAVTAAVSWVAFAVFGSLWIAGRKKWKKTAGYLDYKTFKMVIREEKRVK